MASKSESILKLVSYVIRGGVAVLIVLIAIGLFVWMFRSRPQPQPSDDARKPPTVIVMSAEPQLITRRWQGYGTARALDSADVPARITATVEHIPPDVLEGKSVNKGELLIQLDDSDFARQVEITEQNIADLEAQLERLETERESWAERLRLADESVKLAEADFERIQDAFQSGVAKQREVDQARQALINAIREQVTAREETRKLQPRETSLRAQLLGERSSLRLAQQNVERARIASPIAGVIQSVDVEVAENVASGQRVARIVNLDVIEVPLLLPASARGVVSVGDEVDLASSASSETQWTGRVARIAPEDDASRRTVTVYVVLSAEELSASGPSLPPGKFVRGSVASSSRQQRSIVPRRALLNGSILIVEDGVVTEQPIDVDFHIEGAFPQLGLDDMQWVVLVDPLRRGTLVVADVGRSLRIGSVVEPVIASAPDVVARPNESDPTGASP